MPQLAGAVPHPYQPGRLGRVQIGGRESVERQHPLQQGPLRGSAGGDVHQRLSTAGRQHAQLSAPGPLHQWPGRLPRVVPRLGSARAGPGERRRVLHQDQGVAVRQPYDPVRRPIRPVERLPSQQRPAFVVGERPQRGVRHALLDPVLLLPPAGRHDQGHPLRGQPPGHELQDLARGRVGPVQVVHEDQQRPRLPGSGQYAERARAHRIRVRLGHVRERETALDGSPLGRRQLTEVAAERQQHIGEHRVRQYGFRLHSAGPQHPGALAAGCRVTQHHALADPRFTAQQQSAAVPGQGVHQAVHQVSFGASADEGNGSRDGRHLVGHFGSHDPVRLVRRGRHRPAHTRVAHCTDRIAGRRARRHARHRWFLHDAPVPPPLPSGGVMPPGCPRDGARRELSGRSYDGLRTVLSVRWAHGA